MILTVLCPGCGNSQKYGPKGVLLASKSKRCVYCGRSFRVHAHINKSRIMKIE